MAARGHTLAILTAIFTISFMDRQILAILFEPLKREFELTDTQLGLLSGPAFVLFYTALGIPVALWADRGNRSRIIGLALVVFSTMTVLCGLAASFWQLLLARIGVAVGEAGTNPPSQSIIAELYGPEERTAAMGWFSLGPHLGLLLGLLLGGWLGQWYGWRAALWTAGAIGIACAVMVRVSLHEPPRDLSGGPPAKSPATLREGCGFILSHHALRHLYVGGSLLSFVAYGLVTWLPSFLMRTHGLTTGQAGTAVAVMMGIFGAVGTLAGSRLTNRLARAGIHWKARAPALGAMAMLLFVVGGILADNLAAALICLGIASIGIVWFLPPTFALVQDLTDPRMRALAAALLLFVGNLVGLGLGSQLIGLLSDALAPRLGPDALRHALLLVVPIGLWGAYHYLRAARAVTAATGAEINAHPPPAHAGLRNA